MKNKDYAPVPAVAAPAVPIEWRKFVGFLAQQTTFPHPAVCICQACTWIKKARALLQSPAVNDSLTSQADCRACVNRGRVNGLSQESFCDSCIWQGMSWRKDHHAPVVTASDTIDLATDVPAPAVPEEWREVMAGLVGIAEAKGKKQGSPNHSHSRPGIWDDDNIRNGLAGKRCAECEMYDRARALLQSADHSEQALKMVDAVKRRCEACAILPCSCK